MASAAAIGSVMAQVNAIKAWGPIVQVTPEDFLSIAGKTDAPLIVASHGGFIRKRYTYLTTYKDLFFTARSASALQLPRSAEVVAAGSVWLPRV